jgi:cell division protein FtsI (penicillin-binding protein 3)
MGRDPGQLKKLAALLRKYRRPNSIRKLADEDKTFVWLRRQVNDAVAQKNCRARHPGIYQRKGYKAPGTRRRNYLL